MIKINEIDHGHAPFFECDACGEPIAEPDDIALCVLDDFGDVSEVLHCHRGACVHRTEARHQKVAWLSLRRLLQSLSKSIGLHAEVSQSEELGLPRSCPMKLEGVDQERFGTIPQVDR